MQLNIDKYYHKNIVFEWIPYNQFNEIIEIGNNNSIIIYSAIWKDGPLCFDDYGGYTRYPKQVILKYLQNSQNSIEFLINEVSINFIYILITLLL
jgi:hypothetical protein